MAHEVCSGNIFRAEGSLCGAAGADPAQLSEQRLGEMRALLAERRQHLPLWHAYAQQLFRAGQAKVCICHSPSLLGEAHSLAFSVWKCYKVSTLSSKFIKGPTQSLLVGLATPVPRERCKQ